MQRRAHDVFTPAAGYPSDLAVEGIPARDRIFNAREK
jgi:hypothetical protein